MYIEHNTGMDQNINSFNIRIAIGGYVVADNTWCGKFNSRTVSRLYFIEKGEGFIEYEDTKITMKPGWVYFIPAGLHCRLSCPESLSKCFFHLNAYKPDRYDMLLGCKRVSCFEIGQEAVDEVIRLYRSTNAYHILRLKEIVYRYVNMSIEEQNVADSGIVHCSELIRRALDYIEKNLSLKLTAGEIAKNLFVSESKLVKLFKSEIGVTIGKYIDDYLFDYAEHLLLNTKLSICQISEKLEFCDQFYFSRKFTVKYGKSPRAYRKEMDGFRM